VTASTPRSPGAGSRSRRLLAFTLTALITAVLLASCAAAPNGVQKKSGPAILMAAAMALESAHTYRIQAESTAASSNSSISFEVGGANVGEGTFTSATLTFQAEELHGIDYFRSQKLWSNVGGASLQSALGDRWVYISASSVTAQQLTGVFGNLTSPKLLAAQLTKKFRSAIRGASARVDGQPVIAVSEPGAGTVYVATTGNPYPLLWDESKQSAIHFSDFGQKVHLTAPPRALSLQKIMTS